MRGRLQAWDQPGLFPHRLLLVTINPGEGRTTLRAARRGYDQIVEVL